MSTTAVPHAVHSLAKRAKSRTDSLTRKVTLALQGAVLAVRSGGVEHINHAAHAKEMRELRDQIQAERTTNDMLAHSNRELRAQLAQVEQRGLDDFFPNDESKESEEFNLTPTEERIILYLAAHRLIGNEEVARPEASSAPIKKLLEKGLVGKEGDKIALTPQGGQAVRVLLE